MSKKYYYEEQMVDNLLSYRTSPNSMWLAVPYEQILSRMLHAEETINRIVQAEQNECIIIGGMQIVKK